MQWLELRKAVQNLTARRLDIAARTPRQQRQLQAAQTLTTDAINEPRTGDADQPTWVSALDVTPPQLLDEGEPHILGEILGLGAVAGAEPKQIAVHRREMRPVEGAELVR